VCTDQLTHFFMTGLWNFDRFFRLCAFAKSGKPSDVAK